MMLNEMPSLRVESMEMVELRYVVDFDRNGVGGAETTLTLLYKSTMESALQRG